MWTFKAWFYRLSFVTLISIFTMMVITKSSSNSLMNTNLEEFITQTTEEKVSSPKKILIWTKFWGVKKEAWVAIFNLLINKKCPVSNCDIIFREGYNERKVEEIADAVVFHTVDLYPFFELPRKRRINQPWIAFSLEAPSVMNGGKRVNHLKKLNNVFNWTMSYRRNSDIVVPYGQFIPREEPLEIEEKNFWKEKISNGCLGTWMVTHCATESKRELFMKELQKYIDVDIYGKCGNLTCGNKLSISTVKQSNLNKCNKVIASHYFYFALENSICNDYVTEKFYLALTLNVIPVVFGGADYSSLAPHHSYINALKYETPKELAEYLTMLATNEIAYNNLYFEGPMGPSKNAFQGSYSKKVKDSYEDLHSWFVDGSECKSWNPDTKELQKAEKY